ncbi:tRNA methyltransferase 10 [Cyanidiococcus yangmingshanensis]|uniref:tRNA (guanine(9)-N(1))-methyltransferase n=1 Tax=Cyanidiococcus yangmingshanensis TaxID=2690220 RepID=A0A7J7IKI7_9RHOD|nr:tRNA methyltransferase 10 [Cyanidiococcus yangmingshanensis]
MESLLPETRRRVESVASGPDCPVESKKARKRRLRHERYLAERATRRAAAKERRRQARLDRERHCTSSSVADSSAGPKASASLVSSRELDRAVRDLLCESVKPTDAQSFHCLVDLSSSYLLTEKELRKSVIQLRQLYVVNKRLVKDALRREQETVPRFHIHICGIDARTQRIRSLVFGDETLRWPSISWSSADLATSLANAPPWPVVVLTADATETLTRVEPAVIYVIGGMVDRNRLKGVMWEQARALGLATRRLPLELLPTWRGSRVLTTCHVFELLARVASGESWPRALDQVLPQRKRMPSVFAKNGEDSAICRVAADHDSATTPE